MRNTRVLLPMIFWAVLLHGASFGSETNQAQTAVGSDERSANHSSTADSKDIQAPGQKNPTGEGLDKNEKGFAASREGRPKRRAITSHAKPTPSRQQRSARTSAANNLPTEAPYNIPDFHPSSPAVSSSLPGKTVRHSNPPVPPSTVALNGQQFKNSREPGARTATSGGPANSTRGTSVINGSDIKRKL
jgi:hypothetical protein